MAIPEGKKRYYLTLTEKKFDAYKSMLREFGAPPGLDSRLVDEFITGMVDYVGPIIRKTKESGKQMTMVDFFALVGNMMKEVQDEQLKL